MGWVAELVAGIGISLTREMLHQALQDHLSHLLPQSFCGEGTLMGVRRPLRLGSYLSTKRFGNVGHSLSLLGLLVSQGSRSELGSEWGLGGRYLPSDHQGFGKTRVPLVSVSKGPITLQ